MCYLPEEKGDHVAKAYRILCTELGFIFPVVLKEKMIAFCICSQHCSIALTLTQHFASECSLMAFPSLALVLYHPLLLFLQSKQLITSF